MKSISIKKLLEANEARQGILVQGWVRTRREGKGFSFIELNDGSRLGNLQVVADEGIPGYGDIAAMNVGAALSGHGDLVASPGQGQAWELRASSVELLGGADAETYPLQKKRHSDEFLRSIAHLRPRTNKYGALFRIRSESAFAAHAFLRSQGFHLLHAPIITGSDCEGAGDMFRVTTLKHNAPLDGEGDPGAADFFGKEANLTVSGQLEAELFASALGRVYTFGPTFRAENSNTPRHAAEFWMLEPEMAFADLNDNMDTAEALGTAMAGHVLTHCAEDLDLFAKWVEKSLMSDLDKLMAEPFARVSYREAVAILERAGRKFEFPVGFGEDLQTEHERFLAEEHFKKPVFVYDYPKKIKAFYMRLNDDGETVAAMDLLVPRIGELVGGSQREERLDVLERRMDELGLNKAPYWWYLDLRRYGSVPHAGFGMGFERFLMLVTGVSNIRDVIPFPRTPKHLEF